MDVGFGIVVGAFAVVMLLLESGLLVDTTFFGSHIQHFKLHHPKSIGSLEILFFLAHFLHISTHHDFKKPSNSSKLESILIAEAMVNTNNSDTTIFIFWKHFRKCTSRIIEIELVTIDIFFNSVEFFFRCNEHSLEWSKNYAVYKSIFIWDCIVENSYQHTKWGQLLIIWFYTWEMNISHKYNNEVINAFTHIAKKNE